MRSDDCIPSTIPARLDALPWSRWHWRVVVALGITWILDGLEVTVVGSLGPALLRPETLALSAGEVGWAASAYVGGAVIGALVFGRLADRHGRRRLFLVTLGVYLVATLLTAGTQGFAAFALCRFLTGCGIGGEYAAINSAIDELIPARVRGAVDLSINGSFWIGAALGAGLSLLVLDPRFIDPRYGWRLAFALGALLGLAILLVRRNLPESPRWLVVHGRHAEAETIVRRIESEVAREHPHGWAVPGAALEVRMKPPVTFGEVSRVLLRRFRRRSFLGVTLMAAQAFFYNAIFFTYALVLARFYGVADERVGLYIFPFALGNVLGPLLLGRFFDTIGRRAMIAATYIVSGVLLLGAGWAFSEGWLSAATQGLAWSMIFFFASAAASSAYLTVSEMFPLEMRAIAISLFYAIGTGIGGFVGPAVFGALIDTGNREALFVGYACAAFLMCFAGVTAVMFGLAAERRPLEEVAKPLCAD